MKGIDPIWLTVITTLVAIDNAIGAGTIKLDHVFPSDVIPWVVGWAGFLGGILGFVVAGLTTLISAKPGILIAPAPNGRTVLSWLVLPLVVLLALAGTARAADNLPLPAAKAITKALAYQYPTTACGLYYGINSIGQTGSVAGASVGTQAVNGSIGLTLGYTCPVGAGYWFADGAFDFSNFNGSANGFAVTGPALFEQRFGFGAPVDLIMAMIPGLASLQNSVPSLIPLPSGISVNTSSPYIFGSLSEEDVGVQFGLANNRQWLISAGFGIGNKVRLSNGVVFDPFAEYILPSSQMCLGPLGGNLCVKENSRVRVGMHLEF